MHFRVKVIDAAHGTPVEVSVEAPDRHAAVALCASRGQSVVSMKRRQHSSGRGRRRSDSMAYMVICVLVGSLVLAIGGHFVMQRLGDVGRADLAPPVATTTALHALVQQLDYQLVESLQTSVMNSWCVVPSGWDATQLEAGIREHQAALIETYQAKNDGASPTEVHIWFYANTADLGAREHWVAKLDLDADAVQPTITFPQKATDDPSLSERMAPVLVEPRGSDHSAPSLPMDR